MLDLEALGEQDTFFESRELLTALEIREGHGEAFNVEKVTEAFMEGLFAHNPPSVRRELLIFTGSKKVGAAQEERMASLTMVKFTITFTLARLGNSPAVSGRDGLSIEVSTYL